MFADCLKSKLLDTELKDLLLGGFFYWAKGKWNRIYL